MAATGKRIQQARQIFIKKLQEKANPLFNQVFHGEFKVNQIPGEILGEAEFMNCLKKERSKDREFGYTRHGPHRDDLVLEIGSEKVAAVFSRGQTKLFVSLLLLAEAQTLSELGGIQPVVLIDDYSAELDKNASRYLLSIVDKLPFQVFLTSVSMPGKNTFSTAVIRFHVKHGKLQKMVK